MTTAAKTQVIAGGDQLADENPPFAFDQAQRVAAVDVPAGPSGEDAGQHGTQRAADAVDAEGVQRVVVAEPILQRGAGQAADDAGGRAHQQGRHRVHEPGGRRDADQPGHGPRSRHPARSACRA